MRPLSPEELTIRAQCKKHELGYRLGVAGTNNGYTIQPQWGSDTVVVLNREDNLFNGWQVRFYGTRTSLPVKDLQRWFPSLETALAHIVEYYQAEETAKRLTGTM